MRKDFIIDEIQIYEAAAVGADAVLLIAAALDDSALAKLRATTEEELGLDAVVEVHTSEELHRAVRTGARLMESTIAISGHFNVIGDERAFDAEAPRDRIMISESGLKARNICVIFRPSGFAVFLSGKR